MISPEIKICDDNIQLTLKIFVVPIPNIVVLPISKQETPETINPLLQQVLKNETR
ncbi:MAG: hypothetical protein ACJAZQ_001745 [Cognaticolwellia sp.]|jgi:hypothetical protein